MNSSELRRIGAEISAARVQVHPLNRQKFDVEAQDLFDAISANPQDADALLKHWNKRIGWLASVPDCHIAPPCLIRKPGESNEQYLNRCYTSGGF